jgi:hypothetical protein
MTERHSVKAASHYATGARVAMTNGRFLRLKSTPTKKVARKKGVGLTETERRVLLAEMADIMAELDDLQNRAAEIAARIELPSLARRAG